MEPYQPSHEIQHVLDKWTDSNGRLCNHDVKVLWEEILRLAWVEKPAGVKTEGSGF